MATHLNRTNLRLLDRDINDALQAVARAHGLEVTVGGGVFEEGLYYRSRVTFKSLEADAVLFDAGTPYGLDKSVFHYGGHFVFNGVSYVMQAWRPRAFKSLIAVHQGNGKRYAFTLAAVKAARGLL